MDGVVTTPAGIYKSFDGLVSHDDDLLRRWGHWNLEVLEWRIHLGSSGFHLPCAINFLFYDG